MSKARNNKINNEKLRDAFYYIPNIRELIAIRQCRFVGKVVRGLDAHVLITWCNNKRPTGALIMTNKRSIVKSLKVLLSEEIDKNNYGDLNRWIDIAMEE